MTLCDTVGGLFWGVCKKGAVHLGLFLLGPPAALNRSSEIPGYNHGDISNYTRE